MKQIEPSSNEHQWPRHAVKSIDCRKKDLVIRIANHMRDHDEPAYDVEVYIGGVYDWNESKVFSRYNAGGPRKSPKICKAEAIAFAQSQLSKLL